ncbi:hypothetical protein CGX12_03720 [Zobellella denitrificans]|uniref:DUF4426 domain-containing protein n=1 Tax=Zobellella denitrificans TaxID=347534 RepID=UPI000B8BCAE3|nr:DUF4426 domain-containing protein [Zobellella denitrificans]OXS16495.1 hypothetical protein CGX12_03720 [Zobellella denitrificans]
MFKIILSALTLLFASQVTGAETRVGKWTVHYSAFASTFLTPEVARSYNIERSRFNGLVNIAVTDANGVTQQVNLSGEGKTLLGTVRRLNFQTVREGDSIYYIAEYPYRNEDNVLFTIDIQGPQQGGQFSFRHTFYTD